MLSKDQWAILHQIEITLTTMAKFQRILEGECYVTGSLVALAVYRIRKAYVTVFNSEHTLEPVKNLTATLLADFDQRYKPADESGKVNYTGKADVGFRNRYTGVHPYFFVASLLDPRIKALLSGDQEGVDYMMLPEQYDELKADVVDHMIAQVHENRARGVVTVSGAGAEAEVAETRGETVANRMALDDDELMYGGMDRIVEAPMEICAEDEATIKVNCEKELELYLQTPGMPLRGLDGKYTDPLPWWERKVEQKKFHVVSQVAASFLAVPATSSPSEKIWSRAAQVLTIKRSKLDSEIASGIMFLKENAEVMKKHYDAVTKNMKNPVPLYLPELPADSKDNDEIDVGQDDFPKKV